MTLSEPDVKEAGNALEKDGIHLHLQLHTQICSQKYRKKEKMMIVFEKRETVAQIKLTSTFYVDCLSAIVIDRVPVQNQKSYLDLGF